MHRIDLCEMTLQCLSGLHHLIFGECLLLAFGNVGDCTNRISMQLHFQSAWCRSRRDPGVGGHLRVPSASSSFLRFILSFKFSASRRACWMRVCIWSGETSFDMLADCHGGCN